MAASRKKRIVEVEGRQLTLTNLEKPMYPSGYTKGQVIDYYIRVSDYLLPHLKDRPVTLKRYPNGVQGKFFYSKEAPRHAPDWIQRASVPRRSGSSDIHYIVIDDLPSLVWCANAANLEIHPFLHRAPRIEQPTAIVFDLDPGEGSDALDCATVALKLKDALEKAGLRSFAKVSGSKGIQVYAPINTAVTYDRTRAFAKSLGEMLAEAHPDLIVSSMSKELRAGRVLIDWSQNWDFKTTVSVYSLRAKRERPFVSMPVKWDELSQAIKRHDVASLYFEPEAALERIWSAGDLFEPLLTLKQKAPRAGPAGKRSEAG
jgi:bifunctional non-homologous end joining protein LigD